MSNKFSGKKQFSFFGLSVESCKNPKAVKPKLETTWNFSSQLLSIELGS